MFLLILTSIFAVMNGYFFWRFHAAFRHGPGWKVLVAAFLVLAIASRFLAGALARWGWAAPADAVSLFSFVWLALLFWFCVAGLTLNVWNLAVRAVSLAAPWAGKLAVPARLAFLGISAAVLLAGVWGWCEAGHVAVHEVTVEVPYLPEGRQSLRIAMISDVHVGSPRGARHLAAAVEILRQLQPDLIVSTGDMVDGDFREIGHMADQLRQIDAPLGKYAIFGNHEFYAGVDNSTRFHEAAGFRILRGQAVEPAPGLLLVGVDDPATHWRGGGGGQRVDEVPLLPAGPRSDTVILLKHQPRLADAAGRFDLQLSGHTHGGQIFPLYALTRMMYRYGPGLHDLPGGGRMFVSRGTGTWGPPLRLASPPEVTLITLVRKR